jgi:bla regulator protein BlaR1
MGETITALNDASSIWWDTMLAVLWQSTLLAVVVALVLRAWRGLSPALRCWAWRMVAVKLLLIPFWMMSVSAPHWLAPAHTVGDRNRADLSATAAISEPANAVETREANAVVPVPTMEPTTRASFTWQSWLAAVWLSMLTLQLGRLGWQRFRLQRLLATAYTPDEATNQLVVDGSRHIGLTRMPHVMVTKEDISPFVCRLARPLLVLPQSVLRAAEPFQQRQIVLHELAHVRRRDLAWCWITHVVRAVYWFHPVAYWVAFRESLERELACDELAMSHSGATPADYAQTLVTAATRLAQPAALRATVAAHLDGGYSRS